MYGHHAGQGSAPIFPLAAGATQLDISKNLQFGALRDQSSVKAICLTATEVQLMPEYVALKCAEMMIVLAHGGILQSDVGCTSIWRPPRFIEDQVHNAQRTTMGSIVVCCAPKSLTAKARCTLAAYNPADRSKGSVPVLLYARCAQTCKAMIADRGLPGQKFLNRQCIALTSFLKTKQTTADSGNHFSLAPDHPSSGVWGGQISNRQRASVRADYIFDTGSYHIGHWTLLHTQDLWLRHYRLGFKI